MSQDLQTPRYDQVMRRVGGLIGPGSKVTEVLGELFPVVDVERLPGELLLLGGTLIGFGSAAVAGSAGQVGRVQVFNPAGSGKIVTVTQAIISVNTNQTVRWAVTATALATGVGTQVPRDTRLGLTNRPVAFMRTADTVAFTDANGQARILTSSPLILEDENSLAVLAPGTGFEVGSGTVATSITATFNWRERLALASELNLP